MSAPKGTNDESIGRPGPWSETRYQQPGKPIDKKVDDPADKPEAKGHVDPSTPVSKSDYTGKEE